MEINEIISEKDRILNELYEGLIQTDNLVSDELKQLTPAQSYRQRALQMFLENDYHHMDIEEAMNRVLELNQAGNEQFIKDKLLNYHNDVYDLNLKAGREILPQSNTFQTMISEGKPNISEVLDNAIFAERIDNQWNNLMMNINRQELYMGIRHVMPESIEMRMLINYGEDYINMLELLNRPSIDLENLANLQWDRVPPEPGAINNLQKQYVPPQNIEELKDMHQRFLEDFPKKAKEFILGQNIFVEENAEARLFNEEYYQYTGWGTPSPDMPVIQMNENMSIVYDKLFQREANQLFYEAAEDAGFVDQNEWFNAIVEEDKTAAFLREQGLDVPADIENQVTVKAFDAASKASKEQAEINVKKKLNSYFKKPVSSENFPDEIGFEMGKVLPENPIYNVISNPLDTPTNVVDDINNKAINQAGEVIDIADDTTTELSNVVGKGGYKRFEQLAKQAPEFVSNLFNTTKKLVGKTFGAAQVLDPGDVAITQGLTKILPRLGLASISLPALAAYTAYELAILVVDVGQAYNKAIENQGGQRDFIPSFMGGKTIEGEEPKDIDYDWKQIGKDTWEEMGAISDTWSLSWKISEPIIDSVFKQSASMSQEK